MQNKQDRFESLKEDTFLKAIKRYRSYETNEAIDEKTLLEIEFYDAFRSTAIWEYGYETYVKSLYQVTDKMPKGLKRNYIKIIEMMFLTYEAPLDEYILLSGIRKDIDKLNDDKAHAKVNPYYINIDNQHIYPAPWFLPDLEGNYGEYVTELAIKSITTKNKSITRLTRFNSEFARKGFEKADFFLQQNNCVLAVDAKHYTSRRSKLLSNKNEYDWTIHFNRKFHRIQNELKLIDNNLQITIAVINCAHNFADSINIKPIGNSCYSINSEANPTTISHHIAQLIAQGNVK